ncbi:MAG: NUDIX hydrolase [Ancrocorticia sp.]|jgi:8-oxo-dGTP pyrophosphatase MutT (NUDIX family)|nr:NUDIX hydrolase [Ancrocorticia sp.]MCI1932827.1 NUDIX hydrolase [Ancrocorticia sp.]MCI1963623.1 NUDIX hydrolase [Ancrocorticia sp.]MCI2002788.1 NUDIX hydrolase [Ancrocorticia sp.]MCI2012108.1 NUDIX hydrolase [Ancrocorticia sp.]
MSSQTPHPAPSNRNPRWKHPPTGFGSSHKSQLPVVNETSAGGAVVSVRDGKAYIAVIARRNRGGRLEWCLPKGHLEGLETPEQAAIREISEETGITGRILKHLATIDYWFSGNDRRVHKVVHHFLLEALYGELTTLNDPDQEAEKVEWVSLEKVSSRLAYPNERRIIALAREILLGQG